MCIVYAYGNFTHCRKGEFASNLGHKEMTAEDVPSHFVLVTSAALNISECITLLKNF